ncbi:MAG: transglycosylase SLT domain-containing protein [Gammaproteobacteria bacterium]|nr:transglycosylase SLT domain-containing protein [Gammaproteobacteria bacterium]
MSDRRSPAFTGRNGQEYKKSQRNNKTIEMRYFYFLPALVTLLNLTYLESANAGIYSFADANGTLHYTNKPNNSQYAGMQLVGYIPERSDHRMRSRNLKRFSPLVEKAAREHEIDQALLHAVITVESGYDPHAVSHKGAVGLMQLMPQTARRYGVRNIRDPAQNIQGGARYLRDLIGKFDNDLTLALAAYNAGEEAVVQYGNRVPPYNETQSYVPRVLDYYRQYQRTAR